MGMVMGVGSMVGKMMGECGGAERIGSSVVDGFGMKGVEWGMMMVGFMVGMPVFLEVGVIVMIGI
ncbi:GntT/GntP/DsdX family permease, partial [Paenibacillus xylanexedens]|uniref:GntT/GntP/DsdX family permease n=1 Tax=Paenibacillus xylanexedens TaxID=528191 RepID=UPI003F7A7B3B